MVSQTGRGERQIRQVSDNRDSDQYTGDDHARYVFSINQQSTRAPIVQVCINNQSLPVLIDSGASANVLEKGVYNSLRPRPKLHSTNTKLYAYGSKTPLDVLGAVDVKLSKGEICVDTCFYVVKSNTDSLVGYETATELGLLKILRSVQQPSESVIQKLLKEYRVDQGIGKPRNHQVKIHVNPNVVPVAQTHRRIPFHMRKAVEEEIYSLMKQDIIEPVSGPTPWVSPIVCVPKPNNKSEIRICVDMRCPNTATQRERHISSTVDDSIHDLNGAGYFSKIDLRSGYHQLEINLESREITTFSTHIGNFRYKRLNFGICSAKFSKEPSSKFSPEFRMCETLQTTLSSMARHNPNTIKRYAMLFVVFMIVV